jgi:membrane dipeptidase
MPTTESASEPFFDAHSDLPELVMEEHVLGRDRVIADEFLDDMARSNIDFRVMAMSQRADLLPEMAIRRVLKMLSCMHQEIEVTDGIELALTAEDIVRGRESEATTLILAFEGGEPLRGDPNLLDMYHRLGVRLLTFTHERRNLLGDGAYIGIFDDQQRGNVGGLSNFGYSVAERVEALGMVADISHLNEPGFWDVMDVIDGPVVASHSSCRALCDVGRNLTDGQLRAVADSGGVVGITAIAGFTTETPAEATVEEVLNHVVHAVDVAGIDHVGFGLDFFDYLAKYRPVVDGDDLLMGGMASGLEADEDVSALGHRLRARGFGDEEIARICRNNWCRLFEKVLS